MLEPTMLNQLKMAWYEHLRPSLNPILFPRDFGLSRYPGVSSKEEYLALLSNDYFRKPTYVSVYSRSQIEAGVMDTLFLDIDTEDLEAAWDAIRRMLDSYPCARTYFSGRKGFHIYFDFNPVKRTLFSKRGVMAFISKLNLPDIDTSVIFNMRQMARVPYTLNTKSGMYCVPINGSLQEGRVSEIIKQAKNFFPEYCVPIIPVADDKVVREIASLSVEAAAAGIGKREQDNARSTEWIDVLLGKPVTDARHRLTWLVLAPYLVNVKKMGEPEARSTLLTYLLKCDEKHRVGGGAESLEALAVYYVSYAKSTGLLPPRLSTLKENYPDVYAVAVS